MHTKSMSWGIAFLVSIFISTGDALSCEWPIGEFLYEIKRGSKHTGTLIITATKESNLCVLGIEEWIRDTSYCHRAKRKEIWQKDRLIWYESSTAGWCGFLASKFRPQSCTWNDDGSPIRIEATLDGNRIRVQRRNSAHFVPANILTMNFLNPALRKQQEEMQVLDAITGDTKSVKLQHLGRESIVFLGKQVEADHYLFIDDTGERDLWYDERGMWIKMFLRKDDVLFSLLPETTTVNRPPPTDMHRQCLRHLP
jgi:hypothetical protein